VRSRNHMGDIRICESTATFAKSRPILNQRPQSLQMTFRHYTWNNIFSNAVIIRMGEKWPFLSRILLCILHGLLCLLHGLDELLCDLDGNLRLCLTLVRRRLWQKRLSLNQRLQMIKIKNIIFSIQLISSCIGQEELISRSSDYSTRVLAIW
jgi:hypothetical protein